MIDIPLIMRRSSKKAMWTSLFVILVIIGFIFVYTKYIRDNDSSSNDKENAIGHRNLHDRHEFVTDSNSTSNLSILPAQRPKGMKKMGCKTDDDCGDESVCNGSGMCIPRIRTLTKLPEFKRQKLISGRGREEEKSV